MSKVILTDVDEVLFDWATPFEAWVRANYPQHCNAPGCLQDYWDVERWLSCPYGESRELIRLFNSNKENWCFLKPLPGVVENVHKLHSEGYQFVAITACATDADTHMGRQYNLNEVFGRGVFDTLHCVGLGESKRSILARYRPTFWVEDKARHAIDGAEEGHKSFLINYKHNEQAGENIPGVTRVNDWNEIYQHIKLNSPVLV